MDTRLGILVQVELGAGEVRGCVKANRELGVIEGRDECGRFHATASRLCVAPSAALANVSTAAAAAASGRSPSGSAVSRARSAHERINS